MWPVLGLMLCASASDTSNAHSVTFSVGAGLGHGILGLQVELLTRADISLFAAVGAPPQVYEAAVSYDVRTIIPALRWSQVGAPTPGTGAIWYPLGERGALQIALAMAWVRGHTSPFLGSPKPDYTSSAVVLGLTAGGRIFLGSAFFVDLGIGPTYTHQWVTEAHPGGSDPDFTSSDFGLDLKLAVGFGL